MKLVSGENKKHCGDLCNRLFTIKTMTIFIYIVAILLNQLMESKLS